MRVHLIALTFLFYVSLLYSQSPLEYKAIIDGNHSGSEGLSIFNSHDEGRSILFAGHPDLLQKYIYIAYNNANWNPQHSAFQPSSGILFTGGINGLNQICPNGDINFITGGVEIDFKRLVVKKNGNIGIGTDLPFSKLQVKHGDVFIEDINRGIIMKSPNGNCWRITVENTGSLESKSIVCPN